MCRSSCSISPVSHTIALRAANRCCTDLKTERFGKLPRFIGNVTATVIGQPFDFFWQNWRIAKALFNAFNQYVLCTMVAPKPFVVATKLITSRSQQSRLNTTRTFSLFQQLISKPSEHHRMLECKVTTLPSWARLSPTRPVCFGNNNTSSCLL